VTNYGRQRLQYRRSAWLALAVIASARVTNGPSHFTVCGPPLAQLRKRLFLPGPAPARQ